MRKLFFTILLLSSLSAPAQISGYAGYSLGFMTDEIWPRFGFNAGINTEKAIGSMFCFQQNIMYVQKGASDDNEPLLYGQYSSKSLQINTIDIAPMIGYKIAKGVTIYSGVGLSIYLQVRKKYNKPGLWQYTYKKESNTNGIDLPLYFKMKFDFNIKGQAMFFEPMLIVGTQSIYTNSNIKTQTLSLCIGYTFKRNSQ